jgi:SM-20-related protein
MTGLSAPPCSAEPLASVEASSGAFADRIVDAVSRQGWAVTPGFLTGEEARRLLADGLARRDAFHQAGVGRGDGHLVRTAIRGDEVLWMDPHAASPAQRVYLDRMEDLRVALNRSLYLGLFAFESHFAVYPPGAFYKRHLDAFHDRGKGRTLSCVLYLNEGWTDADGGHLRLYLDGAQPEPFVDVQPEAGTLVLFLSEQFEHEVLTAHRERASATGWFSVRT